MFSKASRKSETGSAATPCKPMVASLIGEGVVLHGDIATRGDLHIDGQIDGDIKVSALTIGETGAVTGTIEAEAVEIRGRVVGTVSARQVRLCATAHVAGDIRHAELAIEAGAHFEGRSLVFEGRPAVEPLALVVAAK